MKLLIYKEHFPLSLSLSLLLAHSLSVILRNCCMCVFHFISCTLEENPRNLVSALLFYPLLYRHTSSFHHTWLSRARLDLNDGFWRFLWVWIWLWQTVLWSVSGLISHTHICWIKSSSAGVSLYFSSLLLALCLWSAHRSFYFLWSVQFNVDHLWSSLISL